MTTPSPSNPLFSTVLTLYTLLFLYSPTLLLPLALSPVFILTGLLLLLLARLGAAATPSTAFQDENKQRLQIAGESKQNTAHNPPSAAEQEEENQGPAQIKLYRGPDEPNRPSRCYRTDHPIVSGWEVGAPLEVIHESYCEGHEEEEEQGIDEHSNNNNNTDNSSTSSVLSSRPVGRKSENNDSSVMSRYPLLARYYPETDSDSDSESSGSGSVYSPIERMCFRWEEEKEKNEGEDDGLIEIELDKRSIINDMKMKVNQIDQYDEDEFDDDEDSLIEINIFSPEYGDRW